MPEASARAEESGRGRLATIALKNGLASVRAAVYLPSKDSYITCDSFLRTNSLTVPQLGQLFMVEELRGCL